MGMVKINFIYRKRQRVEFGSEDNRLPTRLLEWQVMCWFSHLRTHLQNKNANYCFHCHHEKWPDYTDIVPGGNIKSSVFNFKNLFFLFSYVQIIKKWLQQWLLAEDLHKIVLISFLGVKRGSCGHSPWGPSHTY